MKRRNFVNTALASWVAPVITVVSLPAHAETSQTRYYSGNASAPSNYATLSEWKAVAILNSDGSVDMVAQNVNDTVRVAVIMDQIGPAEPGFITTACTEIEDDVGGSFTAISNSEITINIFLNVETITFTIPQSNNIITFPDVSATCTLN